MKNFITKFLQVIMIFLIFEVIYLIFRDNPLIVSPIEVVKNVFDLIVTRDCWISIASTVTRILIGFVIAGILGTTFAILAAKYKTFDFFIRPFVSIIKITPIVSFIIIALVYIDSLYIVSFIAFLMVFPVFFYNITNGIKNIDRKLVEMANVYKLTEKEKIKNILLPSVMPSFISSIEAGIGFAFKSGITAEILVLPKYSLGTNLYESKVFIDTLNLFSYTIIIISITLLLEILIILITKKYTINKVETNNDRD